MQRVTARIPEDDVSALDERVDAGKFANRSEAIRIAVRELLQERVER